MTRSTPSILIVDDAESDRVSYARYLQADSERSYHVIEAETLEEGLELWRSQQPDVVLLDLNLPDGDGLEFLEAIKVEHTGERLPVIVLTGQGNEKNALQAMKLGAADYLVKGEITAKLLTIAVRQVLKEFVLNRQLLRSQQQQILISAIAMRIREFLNLEDISRAIVKEVRQFINADRAIIYQFNPADMSGTVVAEDIVSPWLPCLHEEVEDNCFLENLGGAYCEGRIFVANDIYAANLTACHLQLLERFQVRANLVVPILLPNERKRILWGLLILHQCSAPAVWQESDIQLLQQLAVQLAIAIKQAIAYQQVQTELTERNRVEQELQQLNQSLEAKVKERTQELQKITERLALALKSGAIGCWEWDIKQNFLVWDDRMYELYGALKETDSQIPYEIWSTAIHPDDRDATETVLQQAVLGLAEYDCEFRVIHPDRSIHFIKAYGKVKRDSQGNAESMIGVNFDISDRKLAEEALRASDQRWKFALEGAGDGAWDWDVKNKEVFYSPQWKSLLGYADDEIENRFEVWENLVHPDDLAQCYENINKCLNREVRLYESEHRLRCKDGSYKWILSRGKVLEWDANGHALRMMGTHTDLSDRKQAEAQLQKINNELLRATRLKDEFLANMSHELRTPLNSILGLSESLKDEVLGSLNKKQLKAIATVESSGEHLLSLINDILDLSKISSGMMTLDIASVSVRNICDTSLGFVKQQAFQKSVQINSNIPAHIHNINIDERRIKQVLINLLTNSVKFTPSGGKVNLFVAIGSGDTWQGEAAIPQQLRDINSPTILFQVVDTGIGISDKDLKILFQPFVQVDSALNRQYEGTGLGLALVKQIVELHGGQVIVESELSKGSRFTVALPCEMSAFNAIASVPTSTTSSSLDIAPDNAPLILLAEDNEANIETFSSYLTAINYRVIIAQNGVEAIAQAQENLPDIILMDVQMPIMDGLEAIKQIRLDPNLSNIPIIALTALVMEGDREKCLAAGANDYIAKPVRLRTLSSTIQELLRSLK